MFSLLAIFYEALTSVTLAFISIIIPFAGAYWIYRRTIKSNAETKIFEIGREISILIQNANNIKSPIGVLAWHRVEENLFRVKEKNRNKAISDLLKDLLFHYDTVKINSDLEPADRAAIVLAIATDRFEGIVPPGIKWSGRGAIHSAYGEKITIEDNLFPFGTKLYRQWIEGFTHNYNDLWMIINAVQRREIVERYAEISPYYDSDQIDDWLLKIGHVITDVRNLHSKLITQVQIIDNNAKERRFNINLAICFVYLLLLSVAGYFLPRILFELQLLTPYELGVLSVASGALLVLIIYRLLTHSKGADKKIQRNIFLPPLLESFREMKGKALKYRYSQIENIISLSEELSLPLSTTTLLKKCATEIQNYNDKGQEFVSEMKDLMNNLKLKYNTVSGKGGSFSLPLHKVPDQDFDLDDTFKRISNEKCSFVIEYKEQHSSRGLFSVNLDALSCDEKANLCEELKALRLESSQFTSFNDLKSSQSRLNSIIDKLEKKFQRML